ncbi:hypothetical protein [Salinithrix halophila]|uniref:YtxH-like protein n=1 Tax=Salinithrix halophila TaxID=1485204 RepID=A0ABV8JEG0_9BACL
MLRRKKQNVNGNSVMLGVAVGTLATGAAMLLNPEIRNKVKNTSKDLCGKVTSLKESGIALPKDPYVEEESKETKEAKESTGGEEGQEEAEKKKTTKGNGKKAVAKKDESE